MAGVEGKAFLKHTEHMPCMAALPKKPHPPAHRDGVDDPDPEDEEVGLADDGSIAIRQAPRGRERRRGHTRDVLGSGHTRWRW
jgi:hypothetical protein